MKRRLFVLGALAAGAGGAVILRPGDNGGVYSDYFHDLNRELRSAGDYRPAMLIDLDLLDHNVAVTRKMIGNTTEYRIVAKSLPSPDLLRYVMQRAGTKKLMVFHQPFLTDIAQQFSDADILLGKPMPVRAAEAFYASLNNANRFDHQRQLQWLIDSRSRLDQYRQLAEKLRLQMQINIEIDVGLHRGGLTDVSQLAPMLAAIDRHPKFLRFSGFMGYDPHVVKLPKIIKSPEQAFAESQRTYREYIDEWQRLNPALSEDSLCLNGAGSPTLALHANGSVANELAAGSCLVKPQDFDIASLDKHVPAAFIATPVLKKFAGVQLPALEKLSGVIGTWNPNQQQTFIIYGGKWLATYESPPGLAVNDLYGTSTNQQVLNGSQLIELGVDDHVFLRPKQSESVFLQFGDLRTVRGGKLQDRWPVLAGSSAKHSPLA